jgi:methionyl-tRNA formyltransferase
MKSIYIIGDDKIGRRAMNALGQDKLIFRNQAVSSLRVLKLIRRNAVDFRDIVKMGWADLGRENQDIAEYPIVKTNGDLVRYIADEKPDRVVCYRAGLVLNRQVLRLGPQFLNIHCADLPDFGGLGSIPRALRAGAFDQNACLHEMSLEIDAGRVLHRESYQLSHAKTYRENEDLAYAAGRKILLNIANECFKS